MSQFSLRSMTVVFILSLFCLQNGRQNGWMLTSSITPNAKMAQAPVCGAPRFDAPSPIFAGAGNISGDFNQDGRPDLATLISDAEFKRTIRILVSLSDGAGSFGPAISSEIDVPRSSLTKNYTVGDFNGDAKPDLVQLDGVRLAVFFGDGQGRFAQPALTPANQPGDTIAAADFNGDGKLDVAAGNEFVPEVAVYLGLGTGAFEPELRFRVQGADVMNFRLAPADFNGDKKVDLIFINRRSGNFKYLQGDGTGRFAPAVPVSFVDSSVNGQTVSPVSLEVSDVTGDGKLDVVVTSDRGLSIVAGDGAGGFAGAQMFLRNEGAGVLYLADFNGDGRTDIAVSPPENRVNPIFDLKYFRSTGGGAFSDPISLMTGSVGARIGKGTVGDYNRDGLADLMLPLTLVASPSKFVTGLVLVAGDRDRGLKALAAQTLPIAPYTAALADLNGDGAADLAAGFSANDVVNFNGVAVSLSDGAGAFAPPVFYPATNPINLEIRDFTQDGKPDIAVLSLGGANLMTLINNGAGAFPTSRTMSVLIGTRSLKVGEFNGDGKPDLLLQGSGGLVRILTGVGDGTFAEIPSLNSAGSLDPSVVGDFNGDGKHDFALIASTAGTLLPCDVIQPVSLFLGNGAGQFAAGDPIPLAPGITMLAAADLNGDNQTDLIAASRCDPASNGSGGVTVAFATSTGDFQTTAPLPIPDPQLLQTADLNGDQRPDLIVQDSRGALVLYPNDGTGGFIAPIRPAIRGNQTLLTGDVDKNGLADLVFYENNVVQPGGATVAVVRNMTTCEQLAPASAVSAASFQGETLAPDSIASAFGSNLATGIQGASITPLPTTLAGASVNVRDSQGVERQAGLFFASPGQINFQIPSGVEGSGPMEITFLVNGTRTAVDRLPASPVAPGVFSADSTGGGYAAAVALRVTANGDQLFEPVVRFDATQNRLVPAPIDLSVPGDQVFLILFGTGVRFFNGLSAVTADVGGAQIQATFAGAQGLVGLDQINLPLSKSLAGRGDVDVMLSVNGKSANPVWVRIR